MRSTHPDVPFERYADDIVAHCRTETQAQQVLSHIKRRLAQCRLDVHPEKTHIVYCKDDDRPGQYPTEQFTFLGYTFRSRRSKNRWGKYFINFAPAVSNAAATRMRQALRRRHLPRRSDKAIDDLARMWNHVLRGWIQYYGRFYKSALYPVFRHFNGLLVRWAMRKYKRLRRHRRRASHWRPPKDRAAMARAFVAKAVYDLPTTRMLLDRLDTDVVLRRVCGWERRGEVPSESVFSRAFAEFADTQLPQRVHETLIRETHHDRLVGHLSRDSTAIEAREKPATKETPPPPPKRKRGRPKKGEERPKAIKRLDRQAAMPLQAMLDDLPTACDVGTKKNNKGYKDTWVGYKLHIDVADGQIPISGLLTSASLHDSQAAIPLATLSAERTTNLYDLMDAAYDAEQIPGAQPLTRPRPVD